LGEKIGKEEEGKGVEETSGSTPPAGPSLDSATRSVPLSAIFARRGKKEKREKKKGFEGGGGKKRHGRVKSPRKTCVLISVIC